MKKVGRRVFERHVLYGGLLLLFLGPALFHSLIGLRADGGVLFTAGRTRFFTSVDVTD